MIKLGTPTLNTIFEREIEEDDDDEEDVDFDSNPDPFVVFFCELYANIAYFCC